MSKLSRQAAIRQLVGNDIIPNQDELRRKLLKRGFEVTQATLSRDINDLGLVKSGEGYSLPDSASLELALPSVERLIRVFVREVREAGNLLVLKTTPGSAQPVAAAMDAEDWDDVVGTVGGDDTILVVSPEQAIAHQLAERLREMLA